MTDFFNSLWEHILAFIVAVGKLVFWQWYKITTRLIDLDLRLSDIEKSLNLLREEHEERAVCYYEGELTKAKELLEKII